MSLLLFNKYLNKLQKRRSLLGLQLEAWSTACGTHGFGPVVAWYIVWAHMRLPCRHCQHLRMQFYQASCKAAT